MCGFPVSPAAAPGNNAGWSIPYLLSGLADWQLLPVKSINITSNMVEL